MILKISWPGCIFTWGKKPRLVLCCWYFHMEQWTWLAVVIRKASENKKTTKNESWLLPSGKKATYGLRYMRSAWFRDGSGSHGSWVNFCDSFPSLVSVHVSYYSLAILCLALIESRPFSFLHRLENSITEELRNAS